MKTWILNRWQLVFWSVAISTSVALFVYLNFPEYSGLAVMFFYILPSNTFLAIPHEPAVIYYGKEVGPLITTLVAILPTILGCMVDYQILRPVFRKTRLKKVKNTPLYLRTVKHFSRAPFLTIAALAVSPVPFYPARILSITSDYPQIKYILAVLAGRLPRYYILAYFGKILNIPNWLIIGFFAAIIILTLYKTWFGKTDVSELEMEFFEEKKEVPAKEMTTDY